MHKTKQDALRKEHSENKKGFYKIKNGQKK